jgi:UDP-N-acetylmuramyl pentapeptide phosphotransferase/UDP-N-acetylglucosamine-1-phosphate transferase
MTLNLIQYIFIFIFFYWTAFLITPFFRMIAKKLRILDHPGGRKLQETPVAYLGGLAIILPITFASLLLLLFTPLSLILKQQLYLGIILPALVIAFVGLLDDIYQLTPWPRFVSQTVVGVISSFTLDLNGTGVTIFNNQLLNHAAASCVGDAVACALRSLVRGSKASLMASANKLALSTIRNMKPKAVVNVHQTKGVAASSARAVLIMTPKLAVFGSTPTPT